VPVAVSPVTRLYLLFLADSFLFSDLEGYCVLLHWLSGFIGRLRGQTSTQAFDRVSILRRWYRFDNNDYTSFVYLIVMVDRLISKVKDRIWIQRRKTFIGSITGGSLAQLFLFLPRSVSKLAASTQALITLAPHPAHLASKQPLSGSWAVPTILTY
jgi:hypothetical protein